MPVSSSASRKFGFNRATPSNDRNSDFGSTETGTPAFAQHAMIFRIAAGTSKPLP
jgi:hypothetical protein